MTKAKKDDKVKVHYTGKLTSGEIFDSSVEREPLEFVVGAGQMIKGFDQAVEGMGLNEKKTITLEPEEAYGQVNKELIHDVDKSNLPADMKPEVGQTLIASGPEGQQSRVQVVAVKEASITIDANHPLAGKSLVFDVELVSIEA